MDHSNGFLSNEKIFTVEYKEYAARMARFGRIYMQRRLETQGEAGKV
jgi:hypothetical protein